MSGQDYVAPPPVGHKPAGAKRLRVVLVRITIVVLALTVAWLIRHPWHVDDCLRCASRNGHLPMVYFYLLRGDDVNEQGKGGATALIDAAWNGHHQVVEVLVRHGADLDKADEDMRTPLMWAAIRGQEDVVAYLINKGALLDRQDVKGNTAIYYAIRNRYASTARLLLNAGANINLENKEGETALQKAGQGGFGGMVALFERHGAIKKNVSIGPSPYPVTQLPPQQLWALATTALLVQYNGDSHELLGSRPASDHSWAQNGLRDWWGITSRREAIEMLDQLENTGHRQYYRAEDRSRRRKRQLQTPYLAWDYCRFIWVAGVSYVAGYLTEEEAWDRIMPAARAIQANYSSWREMGEDYLRGRKRWNGKDDPQFERIFKLLTNPDDHNSPWNKSEWNMDLSEQAATNINK